MDASRARCRPPAASDPPYAPRCPQRHGHALTFPCGIRQEIVYCRWICSCDTAFWAAASLLSGNWAPGGKYCTSSCKYHGLGRVWPPTSIWQPVSPRTEINPRPSKQTRQPQRPVLEAVMGHLRVFSRSRILSRVRFPHRAYNRYARYNRHLAYRLDARQTLTSPRRARDSLPCQRDCRTTFDKPSSTKVG